jgi:hypothetical protein
VRSSFIAVCNQVGGDGKHASILRAKLALTIAHSILHQSQLCISVVWSSY